MLIEILCTGDEILTGKTINTNYSHMARRLNEVSLKMHWGTIVGDSRKDLAKAFKQAAERADVVIVNGGLGPTVDDLSQEIAAEVAGVELKLNQAWLERMLAFYERRGRTMPPNNKKQALLPECAEFIDNPIGTACGFAIDIGGARFFFTPGVPREMRRMLDEQIIPRLVEMSGVKKLTTLKRFHSFGIGESRADQMLNDIETDKNKEFVKLGFQAHYPQLETKVVVQAENETETKKILRPIIETIRDRFGNFIISEDNETLEGVILAELAKTNSTLSTAEMHTSGAISARLNPKVGDPDPIIRSVVSRDLTQLCGAVNLSTTEKSLSFDMESAKAIANALRPEAASTFALATLLDIDEDKDGIEAGGDIIIGISTPSGSYGRKARILGGHEWVRLGAIELTLDVFRRQLKKLPIDERIDFEKR